MSRARSITATVLGALALSMGVVPAARAQDGTTPSPLGQPGVSCTASVANRNAPVEPDGAFTVFGIPGNSGAIRARVTCSDGTLGQTAAGFTDPINTITVPLGEILWGQWSESPVALRLLGPTPRLTTGQTSQLTATAIALDASTSNVTPRAQGTTYATSNPLLASVSEDGLVSILPLFAPGASSRVVITAINEGGVAGSFVYTLGPRGSLRGKVTRADGVTCVAGAQVSVLRHQPMEQAGTVVTDEDGGFELLDVSAGQFTLTVIDPATGDRGKAFAKIETEGQSAPADVRLNGQGTVVVTVLDTFNNAVPGAEVTLTALGAFLDTRMASTNGAGQITFERVMAGDFTVSTRDRAAGLVGTALGLLPVNGTVPLALKLQPIGTVQGVAYGVDGTTLQEGTQVRILSRERGIVTQAVTGPDGAFRFNPLPLSDGPFTLDAFADGRLRARIPGLVLSAPNQVLTQNLTFSSVGTVSGLVSDASGQLYSGAFVTLQMTEGLRFAFDTRTDAAGRFYFPGVPVGNFTLTAAKDGRTGTAPGRVNADNEAASLNVQLATNSLIGTVFERDGTTPAAGVTVYLVPSRAPLALTINPNTPGVLATTTSALGQFGFPIPTTDSYTLQAEDAADRGRTQVVITTIDPANPVEASVTFLAKGTVTGVVEDSAGVPQAGALVKVSTRGAFNNAWDTVTADGGRYTVTGVFAGDITVTAQNTLTKLAGASNGRLLAEGETVTLDVTLAATGRVVGQVLKRDGSVLSAPVRIEISSTFASVGAIDAPNGSGYAFELVPVGDFTVTATETATGDKGVSSSRISAAGDVKTLNVRLVGQGTVHVTTVDEAEVPVAGAKVTLRTTTPFSTQTTLDSGAGGEATFTRVPAGDFTVSATKPAVLGARSGSGSGTLIANQTADVSVTLVSRPVGTVTGTVFGPDGVTPRPGMVVRMTPEPTPNAYRAVTDGDGRFEFRDIEGGTTFTLNARLFDGGGCNVDRIRAQAVGVAVTEQDEVVERNLQMIGAGRVSGRVVNGGGTGVGGIRIRLTNPDPVYGLSGSCGGSAYEATSAGDGSYAYPDIPAGNFTIIAENAARTLRAEGSGRVRFDADDVTVDLELVDNAVTMPYTLLDANTMPFDVAGDGSVLTGKNQVFLGSGTAPDTRGMRLDVVVGGVPVPFLNGDGTIGRLAQAGRELQLDEVNIASGLRVTRKIFVPRDGYFARYLETLENTTDEPITASLRVVTRHRGINSNARVVDSSDGDQILSVLAGPDGDRWVIADDQQDADPFTTGGTPATGHVFDGVGGARQVASAGYELVGTTGRLTWQWDDLTVPPGQSVAVMHFVFHQLDRFRARQAALRLSQMPPEALEGLTTDEREAIVNFQVPAASTVAPLPAVGAGVIQGRVLSGDGLTPIPSAPVHFKSRSVLFGRVFSVTADAEGAFEFRARTDGSYSALPIPLYTFDIDARHPKTSAYTSNSVGDFVPPETVVTRNLIFNGTGNLRGTVRRHSGGLVEGAFVQLCTEDNIWCQTRNYATTQANGTYLMSGSPPDDYFVYVQKAHPQGSEPLRGRTTTTITSGDTAVADLVLEETGTLSGLVKAANGDPVANAPVTLYFATAGGGFMGARSSTTDTGGRYRFFDVRAGGVRVDARDPTSGAEGTETGSVEVDEESFVDVTLRGFGTIEIQVRFARGVPAPNANVGYGGERFGSLRMDGGGRGSVILPVGHYNFSATHPDEGGAGLGATTTADIVSNGQVVEVAMTLKPAGAVRGTIVRPDGSTLAGGFPYTVRLINGSTNQVRNGQTSSTGVYRTGGLGLGLYILTAYDPQQNRFADQEFQISEDGEEVLLDLRVEDNRIALPANLYDANRFRFDVQRTAALDTGHTWTFDHGGLALEVNGQAFTGDTSALLEAGKRQFAVTQEAAIAGLKVTRKVFVPRGAYFARYLEVLENPTSDPITAEAVVTTKYPAAQVIDSSSGDASLSEADQWVVFDDANTQDVALAAGQQPATAHVFGQTGAARAIDGADYTVAAGGKGTLVQRWSGLVVPPGGKVVLMHFAAQQIQRPGAVASAQRLVQLPPEAVQSLSESELQSIVNFAVPADGLSAVTPLPPLTGSVSGRVFEGDGVTATAGVRVSVRSAHPLFNRIWGLHPDPFFGCTMAGTAVTGLVSTGASPAPAAPPAGTYAIAGRLTDTDSIAIPEGVEVRVVAQEPLGCFGYYSGHSWTSIPSREYRLAASGTTNVLFDSGILTGTVTGYADYQVTGGRMYLSVEDPDPLAYRYVALRSDGTYTYPGMTPGTYDVLADTSHPQGSGLRGAHAGAVVTLGFTTVTDVQLQPAGAVQGTVLTANGEASVNARVQIASPAESQTYDQCPSGCVPGTLAKHKGKRAVSRETRTDSLGRYSFSAVPPGAYSMTVTDPISDGKKTVPFTVTEHQVTIQNVILLPVGSVLLTVRLPSGPPAVDALVYLRSDAAGFEKTAGRTDFQGYLTVANIPEGGFAIRVRDPRRLDDSYYDRHLSGTMATEEQSEQSHTITLLASATLRVTTTDGDKGNVVLAGSDVYLQDARSARRYVGATDAQGVLTVAGVPEGAFVVEARKSLEGAVAVVSIPGTVVLADDAQIKNIAAQIRRTVGSARATVVDKDTANTPIPNADIYLTDGTRFREWRGRTDTNGQFLVSGIAVGPFTVTARATISGALQEAEATGTITAANIAVTQEVRPEFKSTIVPLPRTIYDANQFAYDLQPNGSITHGRWAYYGAFNNGASLLVVNGVPFTGASQARLEAGTRQIAVTQQVAGLDVTRKVFIPRSGYFARYLEILENRSASPVTVDAKVTHKYAVRTLIATSNGDAAAQPADEWATIDDTLDGDTFRTYTDDAATAHVHGQAGSGETLDSLLFENDNTGYYSPGRRLVQTWNQVTVPPSGRVILMHFVVQQVNRAGSRAAAERLVQLPPEAIDALTAEEREAVRNFSVPADGQSAVAALPALTGRVQGRAFEGDHVTPVRSAEILVKSLSPLFGRTWTTYTNTQGDFAVTGQITDTSTSVPIPAGGGVQIDSRHGLTQLLAPTYTPSFADGATVLSQDLVFPSGQASGRILSPPDYPIRGTSAYVEVFRGSTYVGYVYVDANGNYTFPGLSEGTYRLRLTANHNQGTGLQGSVDNLSVTVGVTATADIPVQPTGSVVGPVKLSSGQPAGANHSVRLTGISGTSGFRSTSTNAQGQYTLTAVPVGDYEIEVTDFRNGAKIRTTLHVSAGATTTPELVLPDTGIVQLTVNQARGVPASGAAVYLTATSIQDRWIGYTSSAGRLDIAVPAGPFTLRATHPRAYYYYSTAPYDSTATGTITSDGQIVPVSLALKAVADVRVTVVDGDNGNARIPNVQIYISDARFTQVFWGYTNSAGQLLLTAVPEGAYSISARLTDGRAFGTTGTIAVADDGLTVDKTISATSRFDVLGVVGFLGERRLYSVSANVGDVLNVSAYGSAHSERAALYLTRVYVYDPDKTLVASGYKYEGAFGGQYSDLGDIAAIPAEKAGAYTIAIASYWPSESWALGAFRLVVQVNGATVEVGGYPGGSVQGRVLRADAATPAADHSVSVKSLDALGLYVRSVADENGEYRFDNVPLGEYRVAAVDPDLDVETVSATGTLPTADLTTAPDLVLAARSEFTIHVQDADENDYSGVPVEITDAAGQRTLYTNEAGQVVTTGYGVLTATVSYGGLSGAASASAVDGQPVPLTITLVPTSLSGVVLANTGLPLADHYVSLYTMYWGYVGEAVTGTDGGFLFENVPAGIPLRLITNDPTFGVDVTLIVTVPHGQSLTDQVLRMWSVGSVRGRVELSNGSGLPGFQVLARFSTGSESEVYRYAYTDANGDYLFEDNLPVGSALRISTNDPVYGNYREVEATIAAAGETANAPPLVFAGQALRVRLRDAAGSPVQGGFELYMDESYLSYTDGSDRVVIEVSPGNHQLRLYDYRVGDFIATTDVVIGTDVETVANLVLSLTTGTARHTNGDPVANGSVSLSRYLTPPLERQETDPVWSYYGETDAEGRYAIAGVLPGYVTVSVSDTSSDTSSGFTAEETGTLSDGAVVVTLDVTMPPSGTVTGVFLDGDGQPVVGAPVFLRSSGLEYDRYLETGDAGTYSFTHVALGALTVDAQDPTTSLVAQASGLLDVDQQMVTVNLQVASGSVSGVVVESDGGTPVPSAVVTVESVRQHAAFGTYSRQATADEEGRFVLPLAPAGALLLSALHPSNAGEAAVVQVTLAAGGTVEPTLTMGTGARFDHNLDGQDGFRYDVGCQGALIDGGTADRSLTDAYDGAYYLSVNGQTFPCYGAAFAMAGGREIRIGPSAFGSLVVSRRIFVPAEGGYVRFVDDVTNESGAEVTVPVDVSSTLGSWWQTQILVAPDTVQGRYAVTADSDSLRGDPSLAHVFFDNDPSSVAPSWAYFQALQPWVGTGWELTIPAGETRAIMTFGVQRPRSGVSAAQAQAESLSGKSDPHMLDGLSAEERARIRNFTLQ